MDGVGGYPNDIELEITQCFLKVFIQAQIKNP
jgi:hypothetical protein